MDAERICRKLFNRTFSISRIPTGKYNESYYVVLDKNQYVLRIAPEESTEVLFYERKMMRKEPEIHKIVQKNTSIPIPLILDYDFSHSVVERDWLLMEKIPGRALFETYGNSIKMNKMFFTLGRFLNQLHNVKRNKFGYPESESTGPMKDNWYSAFKDMWLKLLMDIRKTGIYTEENVNKLTRLLDYHSNSFPPVKQSSLLHMDVWSQNILINREGVITGLIDWDRSIWGDPEIEYAVLDYCGTSPPQFWKGYGSQPLRDENYEIRRVFYILYEHQKYIFIRAMRGKNISLAQQYAEESLRIAEKLK
ncbi:MAG: hypothetical protein DRP57_03160 [Spirochaetes bacterium]|nr:MAG: hypothetical protein DRP57_03160 [Spirochaetota bacterium]